MYGMVLPRFVVAALAGKPLQVYGDGRQSRCFCHVADVVDAIVRLTREPACVGQVYNLGSDEEITIDDLARRVIRLTGSRSSIEYVSYEEAYGQKFDDLSRRVPDLSKIRGAVGFRPRFSLDQIIASVVASLSDLSAASG
jgi:UDP-glucose 4-epimerase